MFILLNNGDLINSGHVVQLTKQGHLQLSSGNVIVLYDKAEYAAIRAAMLGFGRPPVSDFADPALTPETTTTTDQSTDQTTDKEPEPHEQN